MKRYKFKVSHILAITTVSAAMMAVTTTLNNVSTVHADAVSNISVVKTNSQAGANDNIETGTWGTAPWTWNKTTHRITIGGGTTLDVGDAPWKKGSYSDQQAIRGITFTDKISLPTDSEYLFGGLENLKSINNANNLDTSNVKNMMAMFMGDQSLENLELKSFDTSKVTDMNQMFSEDLKLNSLNVSSFDTSEVTDMNRMFYEDRSLENLNLKSFDTSKVTDMTSMFRRTENLNSLDLSNFDTSNVISMTEMFEESGFTNLNVSNFNTSKVTNMYMMFGNDRSLENLNLKSFDTSNVNNMNGMFYIDQSLKSLDVSSFNTSNVVDMGSMFYHNLSLESLDVSSFDTANVNYMGAMFEFDSSLKYLNLNNFDMSNIKSAANMFKGNYKLSKLILGQKNKFVGNIELPKVPSTFGKWKNVKDSNGNNISNGKTYTSDDLLTNYTPDRAGTYVWAKENKNISDLTELYNKVKYSISYSGDMFNSQPGNSMKYKNEFNDKTMFGAMDYAYNSKDYDGLVKLMHDSVKKTHESIGSLQVNEVKAKELGLNVDQLKSDLAKDSVPYDYSQDNDIDGINKQLDSIASVRAKYNKLVQQGVFDKSDYWTINK